MCDTKFNNISFQQKCHVFLGESCEMSDLVPCCKVQGALKGLDFAKCKDVIDGCESFHKRDCSYPVNYQLFDTDDLITCQVLQTFK